MISNSNCRRLVLVALRPVAAGEELTVALDDGEEGEEEGDAAASVY